ncbi:hypothetical protein [Allomuricauda sp. SCSIO 65647]|uniref:hypothetical protein n=1 Tax=Allomuricauda sp. SCSIO 65647 TaxID=2908843 RepID=UPI001F3CA9A8|nr:hypothetical protein [Muricauda sp. SCSIO 65647]UJH67379.1 hypothetical protein L0P89_15695 [Muricauda sp. SCSIO 65647]
MSKYSANDNLIMTLIVNGYHFKDFIRVSPDHSVVIFYKYDQFGAEMWYSVLVSEKLPSTSVIETLKRTSDRNNSKPFIICDNELNVNYDSYTFDEFYEKIGGVVNTGLILNPNLSEIMTDLGQNRLPKGLEGKPDDLLEIYSKECFQFLIKTPVRRYGKDRSFESLPDGIVLGKDSTAFLFDSKAYKDGFEFSSDDINRFEKYVNDFKDRYGRLFEIKSFLVISGKFNDSSTSIQGRSLELMSRVQVPISCISTEDLAKMVNIIHNNSGFQQSINWNRIFVNPMIRSTDLNTQINKLKKDNIIQ